MKPGQLTPHFHIAEFASRDGHPVPPEFYANVRRLAEQLEILRVKMGKPIVVISGFRSIEHNARVKGAEHSRHMTAEAADVRIADVSPVVIHQTVTALIAKGQMSEGGVGLYMPRQAAPGKWRERRDGWLHYDCRGTKARWRG